MWFKTELIEDCERTYISFSSVFSFSYNVRQETAQMK